MREIVYNYIDGNGNKFTIRKGSIEYFPIKPNFSSSGIYDGGKYIKITITNLQYDDILKEINDGIKNIKSHIKFRVKMSGMIIKSNGSNKKTYILAPFSEYITKIEKKLQEIIEI